MYLLFILYLSHILPVKKKYIPSKSGTRFHASRSSGEKLTQAFHAEKICVESLGSRLVRNCSSWWLGQPRQSVYMVVNRWKVVWKSTLSYFFLVSTHPGLALWSYPLTQPGTAVTNTSVCTYCFECGTLLKENHFALLPKFYITTVGGNCFSKFSRLAIYMQNISSDGQNVYVVVTAKNDWLL